MTCKRFVLRILVISFILITSSACAIAYKLEQPNDFADIGLTAGDSVKITTKTEEEFEFIVGQVDQEYLYNEDEKQVVRVDEIKEITRFEVGRPVFYFLSMMLLSFFFSG